MGSSGELNCEQLDRLVLECSIVEQNDAARRAPEEEVRALLVAGDFVGATAALRRCCPSLADNQWLLFQMKKHQFMRLAAPTMAGPSSGSDVHVADRQAQAQQLQAALDLARRELAPLALDAYVEAFSEFKHCMLTLLTGSSSGGGTGGDVGAEPTRELREFAGMVARAVRQEQNGSRGGAAGGSAAAAGGLPQLLRYLLLLQQHQQRSLFHPSWWPATSQAVQGLCARLLLPERDALPPQALCDGAEGFYGGVREHDVQALRTSLGCDREEGVALLRRAKGSAFRGLQDALQAAHINEALLRELVEEYAASRGLDLLPLAADEPLPSPQQAGWQDRQQPQLGQGPDSGSAAAAKAGGGGEEAMQVDAQESQQEQRQEQQQPGPGGEPDVERQRQQQQQQRRPSKVARKEAGASQGAHAALSGFSGAAGGEGEAALELPAELSEQQLRQVMRQLERQLAAGQAEQAVQQLQAADPSFLADHPAAAFALHRCCFLHHLASAGGGGMAAALGVVRQRLSPLAQQHPDLLQPQLKATLALLLPLPAGGGSSKDGAASQKQLQQGITDALSAVRAALRPRCHISEPRLVTLLRDLLSLHAAHFKLQRCQDRFAGELGIPALRAAAAAGSDGAVPAAAGPSSAAAAAAAMAAEAGEALALAAAAGHQQQPRMRASDVPVPGVRILDSDSEDEDMQEDDSDEDEDDEGDGVGVPEQAILTVCEFTGLPRHTAIELLLVHGGDPAAVLAHVFP